MGKIVLEDFNEGNGYYKINLAYLNKEQVEEIEAIVSKWKPTDEDIKSCIAMCLTDANEQRFKDYGTNLKDCLNWVEKQSEQKPVELDENYDGKISKLKTFIAKCNGFNKENREIAFSMIDSLKPQPQWKPSEEQIQALEYQVHSTYEGSWQYKASKELLEQLKKL